MSYPDRHLRRGGNKRPPSEVPCPPEATVIPAVRIRTFHNAQKGIEGRPDYTQTPSPPRDSTAEKREYIARRHNNHQKEQKHYHHSYDQTSPPRRDVHAERHETVSKSPNDRERERIRHRDERDIVAQPNKSLYQDNSSLSSQVSPASSRSASPPRVQRRSWDADLYDDDSDSESASDHSSRQREVRVPWRRSAGRYTDSHGRAGKAIEHKPKEVFTPGAQHVQHPRPTSIETQPTLREWNSDGFRVKRTNKGLHIMRKSDGKRWPSAWEKARAQADEQASRRERRTQWMMKGLLSTLT